MNFIYYLKYSIVRKQQTYREMLDKGNAAAKCNGDQLQ